MDEIQLLPIFQLFKIKHQGLGLDVQALSPEVCGEGMRNRSSLCVEGFCLPWGRTGNKSISLRCKQEKKE